MTNEHTDLRKEERDENTTFTWAPLPFDFDQGVGEGEGRDRPNREHRHRCTLALGNHTNAVKVGKGILELAVGGDRQLREDRQSTPTVYPTGVART